MHTGLNRLVYTDYLLFPREIMCQVLGMLRHQKIDLEPQNLHQVIDQLCDLHDPRSKPGLARLHLAMQGDSNPQGFHLILPDLPISFISTPMNTLPYCLRYCL